MPDEGSELRVGDLVQLLPGYPSSYDLVDYEPMRLTQLGNGVIWAKPILFQGRYSACGYCLYDRWVRKVPLE